MKKKNIQHSFQLFDNNNFLINIILIKITEKINVNLKYL